MFESSDVAAVSQALEMPKNIVIFSHRNPDGDAMGSSLALYNLLLQLNHKITVIMPSEFPDNFSWMLGSEKVMIYDLENEACFEALKPADIIFCLDFNSLERIDKMANAVDAHEALKVMIDHHRDPEPFMDHMFSDPEASSTCEMLYTFFEQCGWLDRIDENIANCLYTGILTDTGSFRHATTSKVFEVVADLKRRGLHDYMVNDMIFNSQSLKNLRLLGHALLNRLEVLPDKKSAIIYLTKQDYKDYNIIRGDTEGIVNYMLTIKGIQLAAFVTEQPTIVKISLRSKYDVNVQALARENFNGGGHINASGGYTFEPLDNALDRLKRVIPHYLS